MFGVSYSFRMLCRKGDGGAEIFLSDNLNFLSDNLNFLSDNLNFLKGNLDYLCSGRCALHESTKWHQGTISFGNYIHCGTNTL